MATLEIWMNGEQVGEWIVLRSGSSILRYTRSWTEAPRARPLSLSLPITANREIRGAVVDHYFDNLLPDNPDIRRRVRDRFRLRSADTFELLAAIGRDCVGAVQLLPPGEGNIALQQVDAKPLPSADIARTLRNVTAPAAMGPRESGEEEEFRISIAGAQEKTALLQMGGAWYRPRGATPTTHILKLPLGIVGNFQGDFSTSIENEWLCSRILAAWGLPIAQTDIACFEDQKALVVRRFDRRWIGTEDEAIRAPDFKPSDGVWIARLPQEDFCQATGRPPSERYESDGGASMEEVLALLGASADAETDRARFVLAQLAFWLLAATDGHSKNFSIHLHAGGAFTMTPLYDVLSAWPVIGHGARELPFEKARLAMAVAGRNRHYRLLDIQSRHWRDLADRVGGADLWQRALALVDEAPTAFDGIAADLPRDFPQAVFDRIQAGVDQQRARFLQEYPPRHVHQHTEHMTDSPTPRGRLYVIAAPSGAGKTSLVKALLERRPELKVSISYTTRKRRPAEVDGVDYSFITRERFRELLAEEAFLEHAEVFDNHYGTGRERVERALEAGRDVILEIDWQGAQQVRARAPDCVTIFILPPSRAELERRLRARRTDDEPVIARRLRDSVLDMGHWREFDYVIVNERFDDALAALERIIDRDGAAFAAGRPEVAALAAGLLA